MVTGGSGLLGSELRRLLPQASYPSSREFNVTDYAQMRNFVKAGDYSVLLHAAAFVSPPEIDKNPLKAVEVNIIGSALTTKLCMDRNLKLVYISTDYVFRGDTGDYKEDDALHPVNKYAWSKLGGECGLRLYDNSLIIRTTFGPNEFPFEKAFCDQWTSRESVREIAEKITLVLGWDITGVIHLGGKRKTVMDYAKSVSPGKATQPLLRSEVPFAVPRDTSLSTERYAELAGSRKENL